MISWLKLICPLLAFAALYWYPLRGRRLEEELGISAVLIYFAICLLFLFWGVALLNFLWIRGRAFFLSIFKTREFIGALLAAIICVFAIYRQVPGDFRVQTDEALLAATAERMYREQKNYTVFEVLRFTETEQVLSKNIDKRPPLFSFLVHLLHQLRGYSLEHSILLNLLLLPIFSMLCFYLIFPAWGFGARITAVFSASLFLPVVIASRSGSSDFLSLVLLVASLLLTRLYIQDNRRELMLLWACTLAHFAVTRMESALAAILLFAAGILAHPRREQVRENIFLILLPVTTVCLWPVLQFIEPRWHGNEDNIYGKPFSWDNVPKNIGKISEAFTNSVRGYPDLLWLGIWLCLALALIIASSHRYRSEISYKILTLKFFGWTCWVFAPLVGLVILLWMPFGSFANPGALRLYAPMSLIVSLLLAFLYHRYSRWSGRYPRFAPVHKFLCVLLFTLAIGRAFYTIDAERLFADYGAFQQDRAVRNFLKEHLQPSTLVIASEPVQMQVQGVSAIDFATARDNRERIIRAQITGEIQKIFVVQNLDRNLMPLPNQELDWKINTLLEEPVSKRTVLRISQPTHTPE